MRPTIKNSQKLPKKIKDGLFCSVIIASSHKGIFFAEFDSSHQSTLLDLNNRLKQASLTQHPFNAFTSSEFPQKRSG